MRIKQWLVVLLFYFLFKWIINISGSYQIPLFLDSQKHSQPKVTACTNPLSIIIIRLVSGAWLKHSYMNLPIYIHIGVLFGIVSLCILQFRSIEYGGERIATS